MAHRSSLYRVCGPALVASGLLLLTAFSMKPLLPDALAASIADGFGTWILTNWMFTVGSLLLLGGWIGLTEHLNETVVEGWSTLGLGGVIVGCVGLAIAGAINAESYPRLVDVLGGPNGGMAAQSYLTIHLILDALGMMAWMILWVGTALTGLAIAEDVEYPKLLGYSGMLIAILEIATQLMPADSLLHDAFGIIGCVWIIAVGIIFTRIQSATQTMPLSSEAVTAR